MNRGRTAAGACSGACLLNLARNHCDRRPIKVGGTQCFQHRTEMADMVGRRRYWFGEPWRRRNSLRLQTHDYRSRCTYFVTICSYHGRRDFCRIHGATIELSEVGKIIQQKWDAISSHFPTVRCGSFVIMPNHIHGILTVSGSPGNDALERGPSLSEVVRAFKARVTREVGEKVWHRNYHDRIIRSEGGLWRVQRYIRNNPAAWSAKYQGRDLSRP